MPERLHPAHKMNIPESSANVKGVKLFIFSIIFGFLNPCQDNNLAII